MYSTVHHVTSAMTQQTWMSTHASAYTLRGALASINKKHRTLCPRVQFGAAADYNIAHHIDGSKHFDLQSNIRQIYNQNLFAVIFMILNSINQKKKQLRYSRWLWNAGHIGIILYQHCISIGSSSTKMSLYCTSLL